MKANLLIKTLVSGFFILGSFGFSKAQTTVNLPEQCDCDTAFLVQDTLLVVGKDTINLNVLDTHLDKVLVSNGYIYYYVNGMVVDSTEISEINDVGTGSGPPTVSGTEDIGEVYIDYATGDIWTFDGTTWVLQDGGVTTGSGSPSFTGTEALGDVYVDNATGDIWTFDGTTWILNNEGSIFSGSGSPVSTDHSDGDIHIDNTTGDVFVFDAGTDTWTLISHGASQYLFWSADNDSLLITDGNGVSVDDLSSNVVTTQIFNDSVLSKITQFETVTTLVDNADGTFTYTDEDGGTTIIAKAQLTDNGDSTFTFTNNDGSDVLIDFKANETTTTLVQNTATGVITYTNEDAAAQLAVLLSTDLGNILTVGTDGGLYLDSATIATYEALTTLVDNADGTFTYTDEDGGTTIIAKAQLTDNGDSTFIFTNNDGSDVLIDFKANETTTTLVQNTVTGVITYTNEDAAAQLAVLLSTDLGNILKVGTDGGLYLDSATIATYEALTTLVDNADGTFTYTDEDGGTTIIAKAQLTDNGDSTFTFTNNDGSDVLIDFKANETTTTLVQNTATGVITYTNEDAAAQLAVLLSTDAGNILTVGTDGGLYLDSATIATYEALTTLIDNADGTFTYTDEDGGTSIIAKAQLTDNGDSTFTFTNNDGSDVLIDFKANETTTTLVQNTATGVITYTNEDAAAQLAVLLSTDLGNILTVGTDGGLYLDSATIATYEALTTLVDNADGTFTYTDEDGGITIIAKAQLTDNGDSTFTFTNNDGSDVLIDFKANETTTTLVQNTVTGVITYTNEDAAAQLAVLLSTDLGNILAVGTDGGLYLDSATIATYEALTTLVDNADGTFTYTDEDGGTSIIAKAQLTDNGDSTFTFTNNDGSDVLIDFKANETTTTLVQNTVTGVITYTNEDAAAQLAVLLSTDLGNILAVGTDGGLYLDSATIATYEALTTLVDNADGTFTYTDEDGGTSIIAKAQLTDNGDSTFTFTNNDGSDVLIDFKANETTTTLVQNTATGVITYTNEDAAAQLAVLLSTDLGNILTVGSDGGLYLDSATIATYEALTTLVDNADGTFTYTDEDGGTTIIAKAQLTDNGDSTFTFTNNDGSDVLIDFKANETTTTLVQNTVTGVITYTNEDAAAQLAVLLSTDAGNILTVGTDGGLYLDSATIATYEALTTLIDNADGTFTYTDEDGGTTIIAKAQLTDNGDSTFTFTNNDGSDVLIDFKANETTTTLVQNTVTGVITYTNEDAAAQLAVLLSTDAGNILTVGTDGGLYLDSATIATYEALTTLIDNADGTFTYTDEDGGTTIIAKAQLTDNGDSTFTFTNNDGSDVLIDFKANETTTTLVQNTVTGVITYTNEDAAAQLAVLLSTDLGNILTVGTDGGLYLDSATIATYEALTTLVDNADGTFTYTDEDGGTTIIAKAQLTDNGDSTFTFTNNDGSDVLIDFKANETTTTLVQNTVTGVITYTNEDAAAQLAVLLSTDLGNILTVGTDGGLFLDSSAIVTDEPWTDEITGIGALSSSDSIYFPGRVAIGTTATDPGKALTVDGDVRITGVLDPTKLTFSDGSTASFDPAANNAYEIEYDTRNLAFTNSTSDSVLYLATNSNVGVGTANPTQQLEITKSMEMSNTIDATTGVIYKGTSPFLHDYTSDSTGNNVFLGKNTGNFTTTGYSNNAVGSGVLQNITSGSKNTAIGSGSQNRNTTGTGNVSIGSSALQRNRTGSDNIAIGDEAAAGRGITLSRNVFIGNKVAWEILDNANNNIAIGYKAASNLLTGKNNITIGYDIETRTDSSLNELTIGNLLYGTGLDGLKDTISSGNIGIGVQLPDNKLHVAGDVKIEDMASGAATDSVVMWSPVDSVLRVVDAASIGGADTDWTGSGTGTMYATNTTDQVVIGNVFPYAPDTKLFIDGGNLVVDGGFGTKINPSNIGFVNLTTLPNEQHTIVFTYLPPLPPPPSLQLAVPGARRFFEYQIINHHILPGTTSLSYLDLSGVPSTVIPANGSITLKSDGANWYQVDVGSVGSGGDNDWTDAGTGQMYVTNITDSVGIGTTTPTQQLEITQSMEMPRTVDATTGIIYKGTNPFLHDYTPGGTGLNVFLGRNAGNFTATGSFNNAVGVDALKNVTAGSSNSAIGSYSQSGNTTGAFNTSLGANSLVRNETGTDNVAIGFTAGFGRNAASTLYSRNVFIGNYAGTEIESGNNNIAIGHNAASRLNTGSNNIVIGYEIEAPSDTADNQLVIGNLLFGTGIDGLDTIISSGNIGIGVKTPTSKLHVAGDVKIEDMVSGAATDSVVMWSPVDSVLKVVDASSIGGADTDWTGSGTGTMYATNTTDAVLIGTSTPVAGKALVVDGDVRITGVLDPTKLSFSDGAIISFDPSANDAYEIEYDTRNLAFTNSTSDSVLYLASNGNIGFGTTNPLQKVSLSGTIGLDPTTNATNGIIFKGNSPFLHDFTALSALGGPKTNVFLGNNAGNFTNTGSFNTVTGARALNSVTTGWSNSAMGYEAQLNSTTGRSNVSVGAWSLLENLTGEMNVAIGAGAGAGTVSYSASRNVFIGNGAADEIETGGDNNIAIGYNAAQNLTTGANNILIGYDIAAPEDNTNNHLVIGNLLFGNGIDGTFKTLSSGNIGIGVVEPTNKLHVAGDVKIEDMVSGTATDSVVVWSPADSVLRVVDASSFGGGGADADWTGSGTGTMYATNTTDQVVVGSVSPYYPDTKLYIDGGNLAVDGGIATRINTNNVGFVNLTTLPSEYHTIVFTYLPPLPPPPFLQLAVPGARRFFEYQIINHHILPGTTSLSYFDLSGVPSTVIPANSSIILKSNGVNWYQVDVGSVGSGGDNDWTGAGTGQMYVTNITDSVGIGTTTPTQQLEITQSMEIPATTDATVGIIFKGSTPFLHDFTAPTAFGGPKTNVFLGNNAGNFTNTGSFNTIAGASASNSVTTGWANSAMGYETQLNTTTGRFNVSAGAWSLLENQAGEFNVAIGTGAGAGTVPYSASRNVFIGNGAAGEVETGGDNNIVVGYNAAPNLITGANNILIGYDIAAPEDNTNNHLVIGNLLFGNGIDGTFKTLSSGNIGIGVVEPTNKLHVAGDVKIEDMVSGTATDSVVVWSPADSVLRVVDASSFGGGGADADWTGSGTGTMYATNTTDQVVVGSVSPYYPDTKLYIDGGNLAVDGGIATRINTNNVGFVNLTTLPSEYHTIVFTYLPPLPPPPFLQLAVPGARRFFEYQIINHHILPGTTSLSYFDLSGVPSTVIPANSSIILKSNGVNWYQVDVGSVGSGGDNDWTGAGTGQMYVTNITDSVGIGTTTPTQQLEITQSMEIPATTDATAGIIFKGSTPFLHDFTAPTAFGGPKTNVFLGNNAGNFTNTGSFNTIAGASASNSVTTGWANSAMGYETQLNATTGRFNVSAGAWSLLENQAGEFNVAIGTGAGAGTVPYSASRNVFIGNGAAGEVETGGDNNIVVGYNAAPNLITGANNILIGYDIAAPEDNTNNHLVIGNLLFGNGIDGTFKTLSSGNIGIGVVEPTNKLHVAGDVKIEDMVSGAVTDSIVVWSPVDSVLKVVDVASIDGSSVTIGELYVDDPGVPLIVDITTINQYVTVPSLLNGVSFGNITLNGAAGTMTINAGGGGIYKINISTSFSATKANTIMHGAVFVNGVRRPNLTKQRDINNAADVGNASFSGFVNLNAGDVVTYRVTTNDVASDVNVFHVNFNIQKAN